MLNLFIAIIINTMQLQSEKETSKTIDKVETATDEVVQHLEISIQRIEQELVSLCQLIM